jgi:hypothetical protein
MSANQNATRIVDCYKRDWSMSFVSSISQRNRTVGGITEQQAFAATLGFVLI